VPSTHSLRGVNGRLYLQVNLHGGGVLRQVLDVSNLAVPVPIGNCDSTIGVDQRMHLKSVS
jgi:hypothetical protein